MTKVLDPSTRPLPRSFVKRFALGGVALTATALATLGLYGHHAATFHHDSSRLLAEIASAKGIQVTLRDANGLEVHGMLLPKAASTPEALEFDGRLSYDLAGVQYNYTLLNDHAYVTIEDLKTGKLTRTECLHPENVPPVTALTDGLRNARVIDAVANPNVTCASSKLIEFEFAGEPYVMCAGGQDGAVSVRGDDLEASLTLLRDSSEGVPSLASLAPPAGLNLATCDRITTWSGDASLVTPPSAVARVLQRTQDAFTVATGGRRLGKMASNDCGCTGGKKKQCLFVHGWGEDGFGGLTDTYKYFGTIEQQLPCCESVKFVHMDTNNEAWYSDKLTSKVCDAAVEMTGSNPQQLENLALIAHSMGNLIVSAAIMEGKCALAASSKWISLAGPIFGTKVANTFSSVMDVLPNATRTAWCHNDPKTILDDPIFKLLDSNHLCTSLISLKSIVAKGSSQSTPQLDAKFEAAGVIFRAKVGANICGVSAFGLLSADSPKLVLEAVLAGHPSPENDGQVHIDSCQGGLPKNKYSTKWDGGAFYRSGLNHLDMAMRNGDGWWGSDRKPIKWLQCQF